MILVEGLHHISLGSADINRTISFYQDLFDFELLDHAEGYAVLSRDLLRLRFNFVPNYRSSVKNPGETSFSFILDTDDFTEAIHELEQSKIEIIKGPLAIEGGESLILADPDGHLLELFYKE